MRNVNLTRAIKTWAGSRNGPGIFLGLGRLVYYIMVAWWYVYLTEGAAENRKKYRFSSDLSKLALRIADRYGTSSEKW